MTKHGEAFSNLEQIAYEDDEDVASQIVKSYIRNCGGK
jgi:hypothetical protein